MADLRALKMQVQRQLRRDLAAANAHFGKQFCEPVVNYNVRGAKAGVAYLQQNEIRLNPVLLAENGQDFIRQVVPHELAHLLVYQHFGRVQPHGKEWKMVMEQVLNVPAEIYHGFDLANTRKNFAYQCACMTHQFSVQRHNAAKRGIVYRCQKCKEALSYIENP